MLRRKKIKNLLGIITLLFLFSACNKKTSSSPEPSATLTPVNSPSPVNTTSPETEEKFSLLFPSTDKPYSTQKSHTEFTGKTDGSIKKVQVLFENKKSGESEDYTLVKFKPGDQEWRYTADIRYNNLISQEKTLTLLEAGSTKKII